MKKLWIFHPSQRGSIMLVTLMIMLILTTLGLAAISTAITEVRITGNAKLLNAVFYGADGGGRVYPSILSETIETRTVPLRYLSPAGPVVDPIDLTAEVFGFASPAESEDSAFTEPDLLVDMNPVSVGVDVDRVQERILSGGAAEFAGGYEGIGASAAGGSVGIFYQVESVGQLSRGQSEVAHVYIHHVQ